MKYLVECVLVVVSLSPGVKNNVIPELLQDCLYRGLVDRLLIVTFFPTR